MSGPLRVTDIRFHPASPELRATGLRGWARCTVDDRWIFDSMGVRRTRAGDYRLQFPTNLDGNGVEQPVYRPAGRRARAEIESAVFDHLRRKAFIE